MAALGRASERKSSSDRGGEFLSSKDTASVKPLISRETGTNQLRTTLQCCARNRVSKRKRGIVVSSGSSSSVLRRRLRHAQRRGDQLARELLELGERRFGGGDVENL